MAEMQILQGMGVSGGIAIGRAVCLETRGPEVFRLHIPESQVDKEVVRLREGVEHARGELKRLRCRAEEDLGNDLAAIFDAHILLLSDAKFLGRVEERIRTHQVNAEWAVHKTAEELDNRFAHMDDPYIRERSEDLTDVSRHLLRSLQGIDHVKQCRHRLGTVAGRVDPDHRVSRAIEQPVDDACPDASGIVGRVVGLEPGRESAGKPQRLTMSSQAQSIASFLK